MSVVKEAMMEQLKDSDPSNVENALFVLAQEGDFTAEEISGIAKILHHPNEETQYAALMVLMGLESLDFSLQKQMIKFLEAPNEEIQARVAQYIYENFLSPWYEENPQPLKPEIGQIVIEKITRTTNEDILFYLMATIPDFDTENEEIVKILSPWVNEKSKEETLRMTFACLAGRKGLSADTIQKIERLLETHESAAVKMGAANVLSQCEEAPPEVQKKALDFFNDPNSSGMQDYLDSIEEEVE